MHVVLPASASPLQVFLFFAFLCEALLMGLHKKHLPLDTMVHGILFGVMLANAAFILAELVFPAHFLVSCGRVASTLVQAGWFFTATHMIFDGEPRPMARDWGLTPGIGRATGGRHRGAGAAGRALRIQGVVLPYHGPCE